MTKFSETESIEDVTTHLIKVVGNLNYRVSKHENEIKELNEVIYALVREIRDFHQKVKLKENL